MGYRDGAGGTGSTTDPTTGAVYIGVDAKSDLEQQGIPGPGAGLINPAFAKYAGPMKAYYGARKPLYKVGYLNSKKFSQELGNMDPSVIEFYQQVMHDAGLLDSYVPRQMDPATKAAFKSLVGTANQSAKTWQSTLEDLVQVGGKVTKEKQRDPFQAVLDDPTQLRETFQNAVQSIYGGNLPDSEIDAMVNAFRAQQEAKQHAAYDAAGTGTTVENPDSLSPGAFAVAQVKAKHPDQVAKVEFSGTLNDALKALAAPGGGLM